MAPADERGEDELDPVALAVDDGFDVVEEAPGERDRAAESLFAGRVLGSAKRSGLFHPQNPNQERRARTDRLPNA